MVNNEFCTKAFLCVGGVCFLKIKFIVTTIDLGVGKDFHSKEIVAWGGGVFENKNYFDNG